MVSAEKSTDSPVIPTPDAKLLSVKKKSVIVAVVLLLAAASAAAWWFMCARIADADQLTLNQPVVKRRTLMLLSSKSAEALQAPQGKEVLAAEIATILRQPYRKGLTPPAIDGVFLTVFVIQ